MRHENRTSYRDLSLKSVHEVNQPTELSIRLVNALQHELPLSRIISFTNKELKTQLTQEISHIHLFLYFFVDCEVSDLSKRRSRLHCGPGDRAGLPSEVGPGRGQAVLQSKEKDALQVTDI